MSILTFLSDWLSHRDPPAGLRNKKGGLAWIRSYGEEYGAGTLAGQVVKTEWFDGEHWRIAPQPTYVTTKLVRMRHSQKLAAAGTTLRVIGLPDHCLEPIDNPGEEAVDQMVQRLGPARQSMGRALIALADEGSTVLAVSPSSSPSTGAHCPMRTVVPCAAAPSGSASDEGISQVLHDLNQRHELWLIEQYLDKERP